MKTEPEMGAKPLHAKKAEDSSRQSQERGAEQSHPQSHQKDQPSQRRDFRLPAFRFLSEYISAVLSPPGVIICTAALGN